MPKTQESTPSHYDYAVIGLGALGSAVLYELSRQQQGDRLSILGIDQYAVPHPYGSSFGDSRMIRYAHPSGQTIYGRMATRSTELLRELEREEEKNVPSEEGTVLHSSTGSFFISDKASEGSMLDRLQKDAEQQGLQHEILSATKMRRQFPQYQLQENEKVYYEHDSGIIVPNACIEKRLRLAKKAGAEIRFGESLISFEDGEAGVLIETTDSTYTAGQLVVALGPWMPELLAPYQIEMSVHRAVMHWFRVDKGSLPSYSREAFPLTMCDVGDGGSLLIFPRAGDDQDTVKVMYFPGGENDPAVTPDTVDRKVLPREAQEIWDQYIAPRFSGVTSECMKSYVCQYVAGPGRRFVIDRLPNRAHPVVVISACSRQGFKYSAALGEAIAEHMVTGENQRTFNVFDEFGSQNIQSTQVEQLSVTNQRNRDILALLDNTSVGASIGSYGVSILLMALSFSVNAKLLVSTGDDGASAASIVATYQTLVVGIATGLVLSAGIVLGGPMGKRDYQRAGDVAKTSFVWSLGWGVIASALLLSSHKVLPLFFQSDPAKKAADFFLGYGLGTLPTMFLMNTPQITTQSGDGAVAVVVSAANYIPGMILSYVLGLKCNMGAFGIGLGGGLPAWPVAIGLQLWLLKDRYAPLSLYKGGIDDFQTHMQQFVKQGIAMAGQRLTEWGNLFALALIAASWSGKDLAATNPSVQVLVVLNLASQGVAHAIGMHCRKNRASMEEKSTHDRVGAKQLHQRNLQMIFQYTGGTVAINALCGLLMYLLCKPLTNFFLHEESQRTHDISEALLKINALGLLADAARITLAGGLRGWVDINWPTMVSLILMTAIGAPVGYAVGNGRSDRMQVLYAVRDGGLLLSALIILARVMKKHHQDAVSLLGASSDCRRPWYQLFSESKSDNCIYDTLLPFSEASRK